ncbi:hypothetical protein GCM10016455_02070 [Aliiroseovarius zhejiangensis]|uniref:Cytochrome c domain-containing protein n=1 Tax=Aliiroseovarius zhejiangensis TaxID=1632025 RepID=A0ABQ3IND5_9RHOB|nr:cytochrome c [Aliiroseovarius zhejiangensis]GHE86191.1 hypothetical protein GCM10016455_02070 [Aliiroseovarius zhejiangensis]
MIRSNPKLTYAGIAVLAAVVAGWALTRTAPSDQNAMGAGDTAAPGDPLVPVNMPALTDAQQIGQTVFVAKCAACHGTNAGGVDGAGPPLIHKIYEPSHHADIAFYMAAEQGVRAHHWKFGDMAPVEGITRAEVASVIDFIRAVQRENGIN